MAIVYKDYYTLHQGGDHSWDESGSIVKSYSTQNTIVNGPSFSWLAFTCLSNLQRRLQASIYR